MILRLLFVKHFLKPVVIAHLGFRKVLVYTLKPWPNGLASRRKQRKFANSELAYGIAKGGQTDSQVGSQVASLKKPLISRISLRFYNNRLLAINLICRLALGGQTVKNLRPNLSSTKVHASRCKSTQVGGQTKRKLNARVQNLRRLASPFGQDLTYMRTLNIA